MKDVAQAKEAAMVGTTLAVLPVREFAEVKLQAPGVACTQLAQLFKNQLESNQQIRTLWS
jgi:branched-subunit amino acid aminotransferase/4-amino-4-deoxychorismate lyase